MGDSELKSSFYFRYILVICTSIWISVRFLLAPDKSVISSFSPELFIICFIAIAYVFLSFNLERKIRLLKEANKRGIKIQDDLEGEENE